MCVCACVCVCVCVSTCRNSTRHSSACVHTRAHTCTHASTHTCPHAARRLRNTKMCGYIDSVSGDVVVRQHMQHVYNEFLALAPQIWQLHEGGEGGRKRREQPGSQSALWRPTENEPCRERLNPRAGWIRAHKKPAIKPEPLDLERRHRASPAARRSTRAAAGITVPWPHPKLCYAPRRAAARSCAHRSCSAPSARPPPTAPRSARFGIGRRGTSGTAGRGRRQRRDGGPCRSRSRSRPRNRHNNRAAAARDQF